MLHYQLYMIINEISKKRLHCIDFSQINLSANNFQRVKTGSGYRQLLKYNKRRLTQLKIRSQNRKKIFLFEFRKKYLGRGNFSGSVGKEIHLIFYFWP